VKRPLLVGCAIAGVAALLVCGGGCLAGLFFTEPGRRLRLEVACSAAHAPGACVALAESYLSEAEHSPPQHARAVSLLDQACLGGHSPACVKLADVYFFGPELHSRGPGIARYLERACNDPDEPTPCGVGIRPLACREAGEVYEEGGDVRADRERARAFWQKAAELGDAVAIQRLTTFDGEVPLALDSPQTVQLRTVCGERDTLRLRINGAGVVELAVLRAEESTPVDANALGGQLRGLAEHGQTRILVGWSPAEVYPGCTAVAKLQEATKDAGVLVAQPVGDVDVYREKVMEACAQVEAAEAAAGTSEAPGEAVSGERGLPDAPPPPVDPVRVGGTIKEPRKLKNVNPEYPGIARQARVQGVVILEATIGPQGHVTEVRVLRGIPLLDQAAIDAVKQWEYTPTLLNGVPVTVIMTITVNFQLK
jgi:TonB family protein